MTFILKVAKIAHSPVPGDTEHGLWSDVASVHFQRDEGGATALLYCREPVKTAEVPGYCEVEKRVDIPVGYIAYVMNEQGKTVSTFTSTMSGDPRNFAPADPAQLRAA